MKSRRVGCLVATALIGLAGCASPTATTPGSSATPSAGSSPTAKPSGPCDNSYFPVVKGATWTLAGSAGGLSLTIVYTITDVSEKAFVLQYELGAAKGVQNWDCTTAGLANGSVPFASAPLPGNPNAGPLTSEAKLTSYEGVTVAANIKPGDTWSEKGHYDSQIANLGTATTDFSNQYKAVGVEQVSVPAGRFECIHISVDGMSKTTSEGEELFNLTPHIDLYLGLNKGFVKNVLTSQGQTFELTLTSYKIP